MNAARLTGSTVTQGEFHVQIRHHFDFDAGSCRTVPVFRTSTDDENDKISARRASRADLVIGQMEIAEEVSSWQPGASGTTALTYPN